MERLQWESMEAAKEALYVHEAGTSDCNRFTRSGRSRGRGDDCVGPAGRGHHPHGAAAASVRATRRAGRLRVGARLLAVGRPAPRQPYDRPPAPQQPYDRPPPMRPGYGRDHWQRQGWVFLGEGWVRGREDTDVIQIGNREGRFSRLLFVAEDGDV